MSPTKWLLLAVVLILIGPLCYSEMLGFACLGLTWHSFGEFRRFLIALVSLHLLTGFLFYMRAERWIAERKEHRDLRSPVKDENAEDG